MSTKFDVRITRNYTHQQIGGRDKTNTKLYPRTGTVVLTDTHEYPAYSGNFQQEVVFRPDDGRLPCLTIAVLEQ